MNVGTAQQTTLRLTPNELAVLAHVCGKSEVAPSLGLPAISSEGDAVAQNGLQCLASRDLVGLTGGELQLATRAAALGACLAAVDRRVTVQLSDPEYTDQIDLLVGLQEWAMSLRRLPFGVLEVSLLDPRVDLAVVVCALVQQHLQRADLTGVLVEKGDLGAEAEVAVACLSADEPGRYSWRRFTHEGQDEAGAGDIGAVVDLINSLWLAA